MTLNRRHFFIGAGLIAVASALPSFAWDAVEAQTTDPRPPRQWIHFGRDPAYKNRAAVIADAPRVLRQRGYPAEVVQALADQMQRQPGTRVALINGALLDWMRSGEQGEIWGDPGGRWGRGVVVAFNHPTRGMGHVSYAEEWAVTFQGTTYVVGIPEVCFNLYGRTVTANVVVEEGCPFLHFYLKQGDTVRIGWFSNQGPFPHGGHCILALKKAGQSDFDTNLPNTCNRGDCTFTQASIDLQMRVWPEPRISFTADRDGDNVLRLPVGVLRSSGVIGLCVTDKNGYETNTEIMTRRSYPTNHGYVIYEGETRHIRTGWRGLTHPWTFIGRRR